MSVVACCQHVVDVLATDADCSVARTVIGAGIVVKEYWRRGLGYSPIMCHLGLSSKLVVGCLSEAVELSEAEAPGASVDAVAVRRNAGAKVTAADALVVGERHDVETIGSLRGQRG